MKNGKYRLLLVSDHPVQYASIGSTVCMMSWGFSQTRISLAGNVVDKRLADGTLGTSQPGGDAAELECARRWRRRALLCVNAKL